MSSPNGLGGVSMTYDHGESIGAPSSFNTVIPLADATNLSSKENTVVTDAIMATRYALACDELADALAPLKVWPTLTDLQGTFSFSVLDLYGRVAYRSTRIRQVQYSEPGSLKGTVSAARRALAAQGLGFPVWDTGLEKPDTCPEETTAPADLPCKGCRLMGCKY
ncbi:MULTISPECIES: hypothetical protein [Pseudomonas]|uniref:Uncharacterized protein n=1 Tax=Pseudomonas luteola TaxID=47886 RepID=A0A2X2D8D7_PSELU|nr:MULTISPECIES: hypothetical protein [Pseudomonas]ENA36666.1 hypothetical protein HMPREF1487_04834 [Pseudomonas sp. HPB0071]MBF8640008.1 hypothetical protein [Pseudomonas zeshuii]SHI33143.1 hypothetical protein SAMN05216295_101241 [Pseudomonas zeshuii]SPZ08595.1 Uncharacterised protein [Pseudomonas luteola]